MGRVSLQCGPVTTNRATPAGKGDGLRSAGRPAKPKATESVDAWREASSQSVFPYDAVDRRIIAMLQSDGRMSNAEIGRRLSLAEATVRRRINRLTESGTLRIVAVPSPHTVGLTLSAIISIRCDLRQLHDIAETIAGFIEVRYLGYSTGPSDLMIEAFFSSHQHLLEFLTTKLAAIPGVTSSETAIILRVAKFSFEWELPLEAFDGEDVAAGP